MAQDKASPDRLPPQNLDAERSVLGSLLRDNDVINDVVPILHIEHFYSDAHRKIYESIRHLYDNTQRVDTVLLAEELNRRGHVEDIGGYGYLGELWDAAPTAANAVHYAKIVRDKALLRFLIHTSTEILRDAYDQAQPAEDLVQTAERKIFELSDLGSTGEAITLSDALAIAYDRIDERSAGDHMSISGISTGFTDLDELTAGLQNGELIIVAARPSVGKTAFALALIRNIAVDGGYPVFFASLEQSRIELAERLLCSHSRVESHKLRKGNLSSDDMAKLIDAGGALRNAHVFIDDTPGQSISRIAANARRLQLRHKLKLVVIDYLQLIEPENRRDPRQEQVAQISKRLKHMARELKIPVVALAQVNRASEDRQDHRPRLADLRESGCLTGETLVTLADSGARVPIRDLVGRSGFHVWALDEVTFKLKPAEVYRAFSTGRKPVFRLTTRLGRTIRATANHKFRAFDDWRRLDELKVGDRLALPRLVPCVDTSSMTVAEVALLGHLIGDGCTLPRHAIQYTTRELDLAEIVVARARERFGDRVTPRICRERNWYQVYLAAAERLTHGKRNPVAEWLDAMGAFGLRSWEKRVPEVLFRQSAETIGVFLRHLWATDGCIRPPSGGTSRHPAIYYASSSERLARDVQALLLRLGINAVLRSRDQGLKGRTQFHVLVMGREDILTFADSVGAVGQYKSTALAECRKGVAAKRANTNRDVIPSALWRRYVVPAMKQQGMSSRHFQKAIGMEFMGTGLYKQNVSRSRMGRIVDVIEGEKTLASLARSDVYWDEILSIVPDSEDEVFDLTVPGPSNFVAGDVIAHNSIEQDADTVMMLHRPDRYEPGQREGEIEVIIAKQRNGPTGEIVLGYERQFFRFTTRQIDSHFSP